MGDNRITSLLTANALSTAVDEITASISELREIDAALAAISKTSDRTKASLQELGRESLDMAGKYGRNATDYLTAVQKMNQNGFHAKKGDSLAEQSLLAQSAGNLPEELASRWVLATDAAYQYEGEAKKINAVLDGVSSISQKNSIQMADMANAMTLAGNSASQAGVAVGELSAILGTSLAATQKEGDEIGSAWNSILASLQDTSSDRIVDTLSKANAFMTETKNGLEQLRSPLAILQDLAQTYNSLDNTNPLKSEIITTIGGSENADVLDAFLTNYSQYETMLQSYAGSSGAAMASVQQSTDNWTGSLNRLSNTWTDTVGSIVDSDMTTGMMNGLNGILSMVNQITDTFGPLATIGLGAGLFSGLKNVGRDKRYSLLF